MVKTQKSILLVEDQVDTADMLAEMLELGGYQAFVCDNGNTALDLLQNPGIDAVVLDLMLPVVSGLDVLRSIRSEPGTRHMPVIIVSARNLPADIQLGKEYGATDYLTKPISYIHLKQAVDRAFDKGRVRQGI
jgi:CheY-like chemotaxis protein